MKHSDKKRILLIEDEMHIAEGLRLNLSLQGYEVRTAPDGAAGLRLWKEWNPHLIILDIMLPLIDGLSVLQSIRLEDERLPVLILSAKGESQDRIKGFACGTDDYLIKPFDLEEFMLRAERLLTRVSWYGDGSESAEQETDVPLSYSFGDNHIDFRKNSARCQCGDIRLTSQEIRLLKLFIANRGKTLSRTELLEIGWGYTGSTSTRTVDNFIVRLRKYFEKNPKSPVYFKSQRSIGYIFDHPDETGERYQV